MKNGKSVPSSQAVLGSAVSHQLITNLVDSEAVRTPIIIIVHHHHLAVLINCVLCMRARNTGRDQQQTLHVHKITSILVQFYRL